MRITSKRGIGVVGLVLIIFLFYGATFFTVSDGVFHYKHLWLLNSLFLAWLSFSVGYKIILVLNLKKIDLSLVGSAAFVIFVAFFIATIMLVEMEIPAKTLGRYCDIILIVSLVGTVYIDAFEPLRTLALKKPH